MQQFFEKFSQQYGAVRRARGFYLYTEKGVRVIDMCLDGARSVLGRREGQLNLVLKQKTDKGLQGFFPTPAEHNLLKVCRTLFPEHQAKVFTNAKNAFKYVCKINSATCNLYSADSSATEAVTWRPFAGGSKDYLLERDAFLVKAPFACSATLGFVKKEISAERVEKVYAEVEHEEVSQAAMFVIAKGLHELSKRRSEHEKLFSHRLLSLAAKIFTVQGVYLTPKHSISATEYETMFDWFLAHKILLSPDKNIPSVFPRLEHYSELEKALKCFGE